MPEEQKVTRKLRAILSADVKGYSILMSNDEAFTVKTLKEYRIVMTEQIEQHTGRVVDTPGDNLLAEFASVVDAVQCAVEIQKILKNKNEGLPVDKRLEFRIGVNIGDVIQDGDSLYGEGVNIAARIEGLAEPGGVCISRNAYDHIRDKMNLGYEYLGEHSVKNIKHPVRVYKLLMADEDAGKLIGDVPKPVAKNWIWATIVVAAVVITAVVFLVYQNVSKPEFEPASVEKMAYPLPEKPSIAVLPFDNLSDDPKEDYFSEGLTEQIISTLSKFRSLFVISGDSASTYKGKPVKIQKVAEDLGVKYVLKGSVQTFADRIRIAAQLIDATTGHCIWSQRYDREQKDIFAIQDDITLEITKALRIDIMSGEQARLWDKTSTQNLEAWEKYLKADDYVFRYTKEDNATARQLLEEVIVLDPEYADAYVMLGWTYWMDARFGWVDSRAESIKMALKYAQKTIELNDTLDIAYTLMGSVYVLQGQYEKAIVEVERAIALNPNGANNFSALAGMIGVSGRWDESIPLAKKSIRLHPFAPATYYHWLGRAYFMTGQYDEAIATFKKILPKNPDYYPAHAFLAACYSSLDRHAEAAAEADEVRRINPNFNLESYAKTLPIKNKGDIDLYIAALRKAGLPDTPPLPLPEKPSIAVLAFDNLSGDPSQEFFSDGISEEIINALSKTDQLFVIARNSSFTYKGKPVNVKQVSRELGVRYVLEGSVRKSDDWVRITAQLIDATTGHHLWAERYDRELTDIFAVQDEITLKIVTALEIKLTEGEQARLFGKKYDNIDLRMKQMELLSLLRKGNKESVIRFGQLSQEVIDMAPESPLGYRGVAWYHWYLVFAGWSQSPRESLKKAFEFAQKAISLDDSDAITHGTLGSIYLMMRQYDKAIEEGKRSVSLDPNGAMAHGILGNTLCYADEVDEGIDHLKQGIRLNPFPPFWYYYQLGRCYRVKGQYEKALIETKKSIQLVPDNHGSYFLLAVIYAQLGQLEEAAAAARKVLELNPSFSVEALSKIWPYKNQAEVKIIIEAASRAGLK